VGAPRGPGYLLNLSHVTDISQAMISPFFLRGAFASDHHIAVRFEAFLDMLEIREPLRIG